MRKIAWILVLLVILFACAVTAANVSAAPEHRRDGVTLAKAGEWPALERNVGKALRWSAWYWRTSYAALVNCVRTEGGLGEKRPQSHWAYGANQSLGGLYFPNGAAGEIGPVQILAWKPKHYWWFGEAWADRPRGKARPHVRLLRNARSVLSQAWVIGWGFSHGYRHHWHGTGC